jgi:ATP-dependent DNA ligase
MGCKKVESEEALEKLIEDDSYFGQEKIDGVRGILQFLEDGEMVITTRGSTKADPTIPIDISHRLPHFTKYKIRSLAGTVLDGELYEPSMTSAEVAGILNYRSMVPVPDTIVFRVFDFLFYRHEAIYNLTNIRRDDMLRKLVDHLPFIPVEYVPHVETGPRKEALLYALLAKGMEGMVFKNKASLYQFGTHKRAAKPAHTWYKYKKKDTVDVIITGSILPDKHYTDPVTRTIDISRHTKPWVKGWFGSIEFRDGDNVGSCSGITDELREMLSDGNHGIKEEYIGRVMEVEFMERTSDGNLRHPRFVRIREELEHENG